MCLPAARFKVLHFDFRLSIHSKGPKKIVGEYHIIASQIVFPKGLFVGTVSQVIKNKQGLFQEITLAPSSDLSKLEEVLIFLS